MAEHGKKVALGPPQEPARMGRPKAGTNLVGSTALPATFCNVQQN